MKASKKKFDMSRACNHEQHVLDQHNCETKQDNPLFEINWLG